MAAKGDSPFLSVHPWGPLKHCLATLRLTLSYPLISQTLREGPDNDTLFNCEKRGQGSTKETRQPTTNSLCFQRENQSHISVYEKPWHNRKSNCVPEIRVLPVCMCHRCTWKIWKWMQESDSLQLMHVGKTWAFYSDLVWPSFYLYYKKHFLFYWPK